MFGSYTGLLEQFGHSMKHTPWHGLLVLDKPEGVTSRTVVDRAQRWFPSGTRMGHTGTLDPLATGVLVLCVGVATRLVEYVQRMEKTYRAGLLLGARSTTDDADGEIETVAVAQPPEPAHVDACLQAFVGEIEQIPPSYSAARVSGRRAYDLARRGRSVALEPRRIHIHAIERLDYAYPRLELRVRCGKGTYIRALARDLGQRLGCGALVENLRRTRVGPFDAAAAHSLDADAATARASLLPLSAAVAELPGVTLEPDDIGRLRRGQAVKIPEWFHLSGPSSISAEVAVLDNSAVLVAVATIDQARQLLRPDKVLPANG
jgi:tRNA pseudouridine55 synthase